MRTLKNIFKRLHFLVPLADVMLLPVNIISICWFRTIKFFGVNRARISKQLFHRLGMLPIVDHYYEPFFQYERLSSQYDQPRILAGIEWNIDEQLRVLKAFSYSDELKDFPLASDNSHDEHRFFHKNGSFSFADAEYLYSFIRLKKPKRLVEIGSGYSTLMIIEAIRRNEAENAPCKLVCIEPYEMSWLESTGVTIIRKPVEKIDLVLFKELESGDVLFIDSSHIIKPEGDVLHEIFSVLPILQKGVYIHFHDIFTPFNYPKQWLSNDYRFWNEQYLLEAFLMNNNKYQIICAVNYLFHFQKTELLSKLPLTSQHGIGGGSLWLQRV